MSIDFEKTGLRGPLNFDTFGCDVFHENPETPDRVDPDVRMTRKFFGSGEVRTPEGESVRIWGFEDPDADVSEPFPSAPIRVRRGHVVHNTAEMGKNSHTIHHHGIETTTFNDGVGHIAFEVTGSYTYQCQSHHSGSYFYHCHKNTVLHFEMGMYGALIVDPPEGPGTAFENGPRYAEERVWVFDDLDPSWRDLGHDAGLCGEDVALNDFNPEVFLITGVAAKRPPADPLISHPAIAATVPVGQSLLLRLNNASYTILRLAIGRAGDPLVLRVIGVDGRALGGEPAGAGAAPWSRPFDLVPGRPFELTTAQRFDVLVTPAEPGEFSVRAEFLQWVRREVLGVAATRITAVP